MSQPLSMELEHRLDDYLSDRLTAPDRAAFERDMAGNAELRRACDQQRRIDACLKRQFAPPSAAMAAVVAQVTQAAAKGVQQEAAVAAPRTIAFPSRKPWLPMAIAAGFLVMMFGGWWYWSPVRKGDDPNLPSRPLEVAYADEVAKGFVPEWECREETKFRETFERRFGQPMIATIPAGATVWGLSYRTAITRQTVLLLAKVNGVPIIVFADRAREDKGIAIPPDKGLKVFKRTIGKLVLCEVTPLDAPQVLSLFADTGPK